MPRKQLSERVCVLMQVPAISNAGCLGLHRNPKAIILKALLVRVRDLHVDPNGCATKVVALDVIGTLALLEARDAEATEQLTCKLLQPQRRRISTDEDVAKHGA